MPETAITRVGRTATSPNRIWSGDDAGRQVFAGA